MGRVFAVVFALFFAVYLFEQFSGRSFGLTEQLHNIAITVSEKTGILLFDELFRG